MIPKNPLFLHFSLFGLTQKTITLQTVSNIAFLRHVTNFIQPIRGCLLYRCH